MGLIEALNQKKRMQDELFPQGGDVIGKIWEWISRSEAVVIGAGAGLSAAAGLTYSGERFQKYFKEFIERYGMADMYSAGFYPFQTQEEKWAYWSRHIYYNRYAQPAGAVYRELYDMVRELNYFVITTNVDHQFLLSGFDEKRVFATQGDYGLFQCAAGCHRKLYGNEKAVRAMLECQKDCRIPRSLVPRCPVCGGDMEVNLRCSEAFVEDEAWEESAVRYEAFLRENRGKRIVFLEMGVGMNTPGIIKYAFWQMTGQWKNASYICINQGQAWAPGQIEERAICVDRDIAEVMSELREKRRGKRSGVESARIGKRAGGGSDDTGGTAGLSGESILRGFGEVSRAEGQEGGAEDNSEIPHEYPYAGGDCTGDFTGAG